MNNTSVIIFIIGGQKLPAMLLCLGEPPARFLLLFLFFISFLYLQFIFDLHLSLFFIYLLFDIILHPSVDYRRVFTPMLYFQSSPSQSDHFQPFRYLFTASATVLSEYFLPTGVFYLVLLHRHFTCAYQGFPGSKEFFLEVCRTSSCRSSNTDLVHLFV